MAYTIVPIIGYLLAMLIVGLISGRNTNSIRSFAIADKKYGTAILIMTFLATSFGAGSTIGDTAKILKDGVVFPLSMVGFFAFCIYMSIYVAKKFDQRFHGMISAGDIIQHFYGLRAAQIAAAIGFIAGGIIIGSQITGLGVLLEEMLEIPYPIMVLSCGVVLTIYSAFGGIKSVTITDVLQAIIMVVVIPAFAFIIIFKAGGVNNIMTRMPSDMWEVLNYGNMHKYLLYFIVSFMPFLWLFPPVIQRFLMATHTAQISKMYHAEFITRIILYTLLVLIAGSVYILLPNVSAETAIPKLVRHFVPEGLGVLLVIAIMSASMSTADSHLNSSAVLLVHNFLLARNLGAKTELSLLRVSTILLGLIATCIAAFRLEIVSLAIFSFSLSGAVIGIPLFFGVMGLNVKRIQFYTCSGIALLGCIIAMFAFRFSWINTASFTVLCGLFGFTLPLLNNLILKK